MSTVILAVSTKTKSRQGTFKINANKKKLLIIGEVGIIPGLVIFDKLALKQECFCFIAGFMYGNFSHHLNHCPDFGLSPNKFFRALKITAYSLSQILCFANIDNLAQTIFHKIDARRLRQVSGNLPHFSDMILHWQLRVNQITF